MKKLNALNLGQSLNREEMRNISGGFAVDGYCPQDTCQEDSECGSSSYCARTACKRKGGIDSSFRSCQWSQSH